MCECMLSLFFAHFIRLFALATAFVLRGTIFRFVCTHFSCIRSMARCFWRFSFFIVILARQCLSPLLTSPKRLMSHSVSLVCAVKCDACDKYRQPAAKTHCHLYNCYVCKCVLRASFFGIDFSTYTKEYSNWVFFLVHVDSENAMEQNLWIVS